MPTIINPYKGGTGMGDDLFGIGGLADAFFGPKASQSAYTREKFREAQRQNEFLPQYADAVSKGGDPGAIAKLAIMAGQTGQDVGNYGRYVTVNRNPNALESGPVTASIVGAGGSAAGTPQYTAQNIQKGYDAEIAKTERIIRADELKTARTPISVFDSTSPNGIKTIFMSDLQAAPPGTYNIVPGQDILKSAMAARYLFPGLNTPNAAAPAPAWPTVPGAPSILTAPLPETGVPAIPAAPVAGAPPEMTDAQRKYLGAESVPRGDNYVIEDAAGNKIGGGLTPDKGVTDTHSRKPIVVDTTAGQQIRLIGADNPAAGTFGGPGAGAKELRDLRVATDTTVAQIDNLSKTLAQPGAEKSTGWVGQTAVFANNLRAQVDAITGTARELGYAASAAQLEKGAKSIVDMNPTLKAMVQSGAIQRGVLESQIASLSYAIARLNASGGGSLGVKDVEDGLRQIGANMHDPKVFSAVLGNLKETILQRSEITEQAIGSTMSPAAFNAMRRSRGPAPAAGGAPSGVGGTTSTGRTWSLEP